MRVGEAIGLGMARWDSAIGDESERKQAKDLGL